MRTYCQNESRHTVIACVLIFLVSACDSKNTATPSGSDAGHDAHLASTDVGGVSDTSMPNSQDMDTFETDIGEGLPVDAGVASDVGERSDMQGPPPMPGPLDLSAPCEEQPAAAPLESTPGVLGNGVGYLYIVPENAHSLLFAFHGGNGSKEENFEQRVESVLVLKEAIERGYAVISLDSIKHSDPNAQNRQWNEQEPQENPDVQNVSTLIELFRGELGLVPADAPVVVVGFSNGGSMASRTAQMSVVSAAAIYISNAQYYSEANARIPPTVFLPGANDPGHALGSNQMYMTMIEESGRIAELYVNPAEPATLGVFTRAVGVNCETSKAIIGALIESGWMDELGNLLQDPKSSLQWSQNLPASVSERSVQSQLRDILIELNGGHSPSAQWNSQVFSFLETHR